MLENVRVGVRKDDACGLGGGCWIAARVLQNVPMLSAFPSNSTRASKDEKEQGWVEERRWLTMMRALSVARTLTFAMLESMCMRIGCPSCMKICLRSIPWILHASTNVYGTK